MGGLDPKFLRESCEAVEPGENVSEILSDMWEYIDQTSKGKLVTVGMAANQFGYKKRIIIINTRTLRQVMINPEIVKRSKNRMKSEEQCRSFPGKKVSVMRNKQVTVEAIDENFEPIRFKMRGYDAAVVQHEIDHIDGITMLDRVRKW